MTASEDGGSTPPSRQFANLILLIGLVASAIALSLALTGRTALSVQVCGVAILFALAVLIFGGLVVASNKRDEG